MDELQGLAIGIIGFAVIIGVGTVVLTRFGDVVADCNTTNYFNTSTQLCTALDNESITSSAGGTAYGSTTYLNTQIGTSGLAGWIPAVVAITVGLLFLSYFIGKRSRRV